MTLTAPGPGDVAAVRRSVAVALDGRRPDEDDRFRAAEGVGGFVRALAAEAAARLEGKPAELVVAWAAGVVPRLTVTSSFGAESAVLLHVVSRVAPDLPVLFVDTDLHFSDTIDYRRRLAQHLGLTVVDVRPDLSPAQQDARHGASLYSRDPDACCRLRKTAPLRRALASYDGWMTGVRRVQTPERAATPVVEARAHDGRWLVKIAPLVRWSDGDVDAYLRAHDLPRHPLTSAGYRSIGCAPCTAPVGDDEDARAGRWAAFGKTECGLHLLDDTPAERHASTPG